MSTQTARITVLGTPEFKKFLQQEAKKEGISLSTLVRRRCEQKPLSEDEELLMQLLAELKSSTAKAKKSLDEGLEEAQRFLAEIKARDEEATTV